MILLVMENKILVSLPCCFLTERNLTTQKKKKGVLLVSAVWIVGRWCQVVGDLAGISDGWDQTLRLFLASPKVSAFILSATSVVWSALSYKGPGWHPGEHTWTWVSVLGAHLSYALFFRGFHKPASVSAHLDCSLCMVISQASQVTVQ